MHIQAIGKSPNEQHKECMMRKLILIGAASAVTLTAAAYALPGAKPSKMDIDGNGVVTKAEAMTGADAMFVKMDVNKDGTVNATDHEAKIKAHFQEMDADKNGAINEAEFVAAHKDRMENRLERRAARGDDGGRGDGHKGGRNGRGEGGHDMMMKNADANNDAAVTQAEFRTAAEMRFTKADANNDGALSAAEQHAARKAMRGMRGDMRQPEA